MSFPDMLLSLLILIPVLGGILILALPEKLARPGALMVSGATFLLSTQLYALFDKTKGAVFSPGGAQFELKLPWVEAFNINYHVGVDGISMPLIVLTTFITLLVIGTAGKLVTFKLRQYLANFLIMEGIMVGVFSALDALLFYLFWEAMLIPMFLIIGIWGGPRRVYATIKFFLFTFLGSVVMLVALIYLYHKAPPGSGFSILAFYKLDLSLTEQIFIFIAFLLAFAVKVPMWPVHTWLPDAHVEAPTGGSVILAAIMLKIGGYGFLRFSMPITPWASMELAWVIILMSLVAIVYISFIALVQQDMKKLIAYSSIAHMGFVTLGFFIIFAIMKNNLPLPESLKLATGSVAAVQALTKGTALAVEGGIVQMVSHGFISAALFLCVGVLYDRVHSREISAYGGVVNTMPFFAAFFVFFAMANAGLPGTSGFVGELMVILASFKANFWFAFLAATTLILGAAYTLWMIKRVVFGPVANDQVRTLTPLNVREALVLSALVAAVLFFGVWPEPLVSVMHQSVSDLTTHIAEKLGPRLGKF